MYSLEFIVQININIYIIYYIYIYSYICISYDLITMYYVLNVYSISNGVHKCSLLRTVSIIEQLCTDDTSTKYYMYYSNSSCGTVIIL